MTNEKDRKMILDFCDECHEHPIDGEEISQKPCKELSTDDCRMLRLYIADDPESHAFGEMHGIFEYEGDIYKFTWHIHKPKQGAATLSNRMTDIKRLTVERKDGLALVSTSRTENGHDAFLTFVSDTELNEFDLSLRRLMRRIKAYAVSEELCKRIRKLDNQHLKWLKKQQKSVAGEEGPVL